MIRIGQVIVTRLGAKNTEKRCKFEYCMGFQYTGFTDFWGFWRKVYIFSHVIKPIVITATMVSRLVWPDRKFL